ncbi:MAG: hypothetical protein KBC12_01680 [Candidatus Pacebacteria bacterium]|nr:hypothetical protein [Candidatus Paceibacterota bacterium]MBP9851397.1 hypothetical protein [Candidatus Paceibacterota bacterium]
MQNINKQKGVIPLVISILVVLVVLGGGVYLYTNKSNVEESNKAELSDVKTYSVDDPIFATSPKGLFLERNTELYNAGSFDEMMKVASKYDTEARRAENESLFKEANDGKKDAYFGFAQALMIPTSDFTQVAETIDGDTATVIAYDKRQQKTVASFIKENGEWKMIDIKTMLTGSNN